MPLAEVLAIEVGSSIAKSIITIWLKDATLAQDASLSLVDILKSRISNTFDLLSAYPNNPAARKAIKPQAKWRNAR